MSDEIHDDAEIDDAAIDDEDAEVEGHVMFAAKKGFGLTADINISPTFRPEGMDDWEHNQGQSGLNTNEPVLSDDVIDGDENEDAEVEGHVMFAEKKGFSLKPDLYAPPCEPQLDDWERGGYAGNTNEPVLDDVV